MLAKFEKMSWFVDICQCYLFFSQWIALLCPLGNSRQCSVHCTINPESVNCTMTFKVTCFVCNFNFSLTSFTARYIDTLSVTFHFIMPWIKSYFDFNVMRNYHTRYLYWTYSNLADYYDSLDINLQRSSFKLSLVRPSYSDTVVFQKTVNDV